MKNLMLFAISFIGFMVFSIAGCKKTNPAANTDFYCRMAINGVKVNCESNLSANKTTVQNPLLNVSWRWPGGSLQIQVFNFNNMPGTWVVNPVLGSSPRFTLFLGQTEYDAGDGGFNAVQHGSGQLVILEVNDRSVKGNFSFTTAPSLFDNQLKTVTEGSFQVERNR